MRHLNAGRKFGRNTSHRRAMFRNLAANLIAHERIETTDAKAKELRRVTERLISKAKRLGEVAYTTNADLKPEDRAKRLHAQRVVGTFLPRFGTRLEDGKTKKIDLIEKVFVDLAKRFKGRPGGYTRIIKIGPRRGDNASLSLIEFVKDAAAAAPAAPEGEPKKGKKKSSTKTKAKGATAAQPATGGSKAG
jgi:large subunit ribosomal protein L17